MLNFCGLIIQPQWFSMTSHEVAIKSACRKFEFGGCVLEIQNVDEKISNTIHYNWKLNDELLTFFVKARLNILPTNFTLYIWNRVNDPKCQFWNHCAESMAQLLNGCHAEFGNFYSKRHNKIVNYLFWSVEIYK